MLARNIGLLRLPIQFGSGFALPSRAILAPMEGVMKPLFCRAVSELGLIDAWFAPFISVTGGAVPAKAVIKRKLKPFIRPSMPLVAQVLGRSPEAMAECAWRMAQLGVKAVNLNFACPSRVVTGNGGGGAMLGDPALLGKTVASVVKACPGISVSVKLRSGFSSPEEMEKIVPAACEAGIDFIIFHFRTVAEGYRGISGSLERIGKAVSLAGGIPLFGNGDIEDASGACKMQKACGCAGVAVARGFLRDPFILRRFARPESPESPETEKGRRLLLTKMLELAKARDERWSRSNFLETAALSFGAESSLFLRLARMSDATLLSENSLEEACAGA